MTDTELKLLVLFRQHSVHLETICEHYLGMSPTVARQRAALNTLPFPTFRTGDSAKAPLMVKVADLAAVIDAQHSNARSQWEQAQLRHHA